MNFVSIIFNIITAIQVGCGSCPGPPPGCLPCCNAPGGCGPPPPPGFPIDNYIYVLFFAALVLGAYVISKKQQAI